MFKKIVERLESLAAGRENHFDPSKFNDEVALTTCWVPLKRGGTSFRTHALSLGDGHRIEFKSSLGAKAFSLLFVICGAGALAAGLHQLFVGTEAGAYFFLMAFGTVFAGVGALIGFFISMPVVFDRRRNLFWKSWSTPEPLHRSTNGKNSCQLSDIHAIQILHEYCRSRESSYSSYELNLVLSDGRRINVVDHGGLEALQQDAQQLSQFLGKPVWDATSGW